MPSNYRRYSQAGISLLEILLVLTVAALIFVLGFRQYSQFLWSRDVAQIQQSVTQLLQAVNVYYYANCASTDFHPPYLNIDYALLKKAGGLENFTQLKNPWGNPFVVSLVSSQENSQETPGLLLLQVSADFPNYADRIDALANLLNAAKMNGTQLAWIRLPSQSINHVSFSVMSSGGWVPIIGGSSIGGLPVSTNSLWLQRSNLETFKKVENKNAGNMQVICPN